MERTRGQLTIHIALPEKTMEALEELGRRNKRTRTQQAVWEFERLPAIQRVMRELQEAEGGESSAKI